MKDEIKKNLKELMQDYLRDVDEHNSKRHDRLNKYGTDFENDTEPTFENFIKWLM